MKTIKLGDKVQFKDNLHGTIIGKVVKLEIRDKQYVEELNEKMNLRNAWVHVNVPNLTTFPVFFDQCEVLKMKDLNMRENEKIEVIFREGKVIAKRGNNVGVAECSLDPSKSTTIAIEKLLEKEGEKANKTRSIQIGDMVKVTDVSEQVLYCDSWFEQNDIPIEQCVHYAYGAKFNNRDVGVVVNIAPEPRFYGNYHKNPKKYYLIKFGNNDALFLFKKEGIRKIPKRKYS